MAHGGRERPSGHGVRSRCVRAAMVAVHAATAALTAIGSRLERHRALWLLVLAGVVFAMGLIGFATHEELGRRDWTDHVYLTLQLFVLNWAPEGVPPLALEVARFTAPVVAVLGGLALIRVLLAGRVSRLRARVLSDHLVVCGAGAKGATLARSASARGRQVVLLDRSPAHAAGVAQPGVVRLESDATEPRDLRRARVATAREVVALCGSDAVNIEVAHAVAAACAQARATARGPRTYVHLSNDRLGRLLRASPALAALRVEPFNVFDTSSRALLARHGVGQGLWVVGDDELAGRLVLQAARYWRSVRGAEDGELPVRLVIPRAEQEADALRAAAPDLESYVDVHPVELALARDRVLPDLGGCAGRQVVVCASADEGAAVTFALDVRERCSANDLTVCARVVTLESGFGNIIADADAGVLPFAVLAEALEPGRLFAWRRELLARVQHTDWLRRRPADAPADAFAHRWDDLSPAARDQNLARAELQLARLDGFGIEVEDSLAWDVPSIALAEGETERLAEDEHQRWKASREAEGWRWGPAKDAQAQTHPDLVDWPDLRHDSRGYNLEVARTLPGTLASLGVALVRRQGAAASAAVSARAAEAGV